jgi:hypothetical protein
MSWKESIFGEVLFCFEFRLFENEWIRAFFVWSGDRHFCLFFGIGCTVPYIIFFFVVVSHVSVFVFLRFWFCCVWICCWRPFFISAMFHTFCNQKCHRWTFVIN